MPTPPDGTTVLTSPRPAGWVRVLSAVAVIVVVAMWVVILRGSSPPLYLPLIAPTALAVVLLIQWFRPPRIELHPTGLVVVPLLRTRRVSYADITAVVGDSGRLAWSTRLHLELAGGKRLVLPRVGASLAETHDLITRRAGLAAIENPSDRG